MARLLSGNRRNPNAVQTKYRTAKPIYQTQPRTCLRCGKVFNSIGPGNRICCDSKELASGIRRFSLNGIR